jgi:hypothetical protein
LEKVLIGLAFREMMIHVVNPFFSINHQDICRRELLLLEQSHGGDGQEK